MVQGATAPLLHAKVRKVDVERRNHRYSEVLDAAMTEVLEEKRR